LKWLQNNPICQKINLTNFWNILLVCMLWSSCETIWLTVESGMLFLMPTYLSSHFVVPREMYITLFCPIQSSLNICLVCLLFLDMFCSHSSDQSRELMKLLDFSVREIEAGLYASHPKQLQLLSLLSQFSESKQLHACKV
jgi:hypothetical protein